MSRSRFLEQFEYAVETDFSLHGVPASWADGEGKSGHRCWDDEDYKIEVPSSGDSQGNTAVSAVSSDEEFIAAASGNLITVYHIGSKERRSQFRGLLADCQRLLFVPSRSSLSNNGEGYQLISESSKVSGSDGVLILWRLDQFGRRSDVVQPVPAPQFVRQSLDAIMPSLADDHGLSQMSPLLEQVLNDYTKALERLSSRVETQYMETLQGHIPTIGHKNLFSPDGNTFIYFTNNKTTQHGMRPREKLPHIVLYDMTTRTQKHALGGHDDVIMWAAFSPDGKNIASASWDQTFRIWDVSSGNLIHAVGPTGGQNWSGAWSQDSKYVLFSGRVRDGTILVVHDRATGEEVARFEHEHLKDRAMRLDWSVQGEIAIACGVNVWVWKPFENIIISNFSLEIKQRLMRGFADMMGLWWVDGDTRLVVHTGDGTVEVWDRTKNVKWRLQRPKGTNMPKFSRGIYWVVKHNSLIKLDGDGCLRFWELST